MVEFKDIILYFIKRIILHVRYYEIKLRRNLSFKCVIKIPRMPFFAG